MSLAHTNKINRMYSHTTSVEERKPTPPMSPVGELKLKQAEDQRAFGAKSRTATMELNDKHQAQRNADNVIRNGGGVHDHIVERERAEHAKLDAKLTAERGRMKSRHQAEMEAALKQHGVAP
ncbi:hypothetical protein [Rhodopila sp.]|uniref:hypothetical protein n=1 Tax=Rhodopila sp. TaxID=2480087 RepID=UPI003D0DEAAC